MRTVAAWAVAYLVLLQTLLTGVALASVPLGPDGPLCISVAEKSGTGAATGDLPDQGGGPHLHCQACLARAETPVLPPLPAPVAERIPTLVAYAAPPLTAGAHAVAHRAFQPRGPPPSPVSASV